MTPSEFKFRHYCFTLFAETDDGPDEAATRFESIVTGACGRLPCCRFMVGQLEQCPTTERLHLQGYLELTRPHRFSYIQSNWPGFENAHFEPRRGSQTQAIEYCEKEESRMAGPWRSGNVITQGSRSELCLIAESIDSGESILSLFRSYPSSIMRYGRGIRDYASLARSLIKVDWEMEVIVFWGEPGSGKTQKAKRMFPGAYQWMPQRGNTIWWDGYEGQETIIIDEFANNFPYHYGLRILGDAGCRVETKGNTTQLLAKRVVITSMTSPIDWWPNMEDHRYALYRRIHWCYRFAGDWLAGTQSIRPDYFPVPDKRPGDLWILSEIDFIDLDSIINLSLPSPMEEAELGSTDELPQA